VCQITGQKRARPGLQGAQSAVPLPSSTLIDKRTPAFSNQCLVRLLDAVVDDGVVPVSQLMQVLQQWVLKNSIYLLGAFGNDLIDLNSVFPPNLKLNLHAGRVSG
jgi:hypothetical protein